MQVQTYGSKEAIQSNKQLLELKNKQKQLNALSVDALKTGLQQKYDEVGRLSRWIDTDMGMIGWDGPDCV